jgi:hypothetical protein
LLPFLFPCRGCNKEKSHDPSVPWFSERLSSGEIVVPVDISGYSERSSGCPPGVKAGNIQGVSSRSRRWDNEREAQQSTDIRIMSALTMVLWIVFLPENALPGIMRPINHLTRILRIAQNLKKRRHQREIRVQEKTEWKKLLGKKPF